MFWLLENFPPSYIKYSVADIFEGRFQLELVASREAGQIMLWKRILSFPIN
jgi:hypothetical protein